MKKEFNIYKFLLLFGVICISGLFTSCDDDDDTSNGLPRLFSPVNLNVETKGVVATITWARSEGAVSYTIEISQDSLAFNNIILSETTESLFYVAELAQSTQYSVRVKANAENESMNSLFNDNTVFKTSAENLFNGYTNNMTAKGTISLNWLPESNVTKIVCTPSDGSNPHTFEINNEAKENGSMVCSNLPNSKYTVELYNGENSRGKITLIVEGDIFLKSGDSLQDALNSAEAGNVIVLESGTVFTVGKNTFRFDKNIKIMGYAEGEKAVLSMTADVSSGTSMFGFVDGSEFDYVKFENLRITGYAENNNESGTKIAYLFNNNTVTKVTDLSFTNCDIIHYGNTPFRLQGNKSQVIGNLTIDGCIITDIGFGSTYAIVNINSTDFFNNIIFRNSTIYNFKGAFIMRQKESVNSILVENCTINQGMLDEASVRFLIDCNTADVKAGITLKNCLLGSSGKAAGVRPDDKYTEISGNYYTSDYVDETPVGEKSYSIKGKSTSYNGSSTDLWTDPVNGNFRFKDSAFAGKSSGDQRWNK